MRLLVQRVLEASCRVDGNVTGSIGRGLLLFVGCGPEDNEGDCEKLAEKIAKFRVFEDENGKMNRNIFAAEGKILSISQFTLYADVKKGNRPSFTGAMEPVEAKRLYLYFNECLRKLDLTVEEGIFGADMKIALINDGPLTFWIDSRE